MESTAAPFPGILAGMQPMTLATSALHPAVVIIVLIMAIAWCWGQWEADRCEIRKEAARWKARIIGIKWLPCHTLNTNETAYEVTLQLDSGKRVSAICRCSLYDDLVWEGPPWWAHAQSPPHQPTPDHTGATSFRDTLAAPAPWEPPADSSRIVADCTRCGHILLKSSIVCPNCGTEAPVP